MATIKLGNSKNANALLRYAEKRSEVSCGVNCDVEYARSQMTATREIWGKNNGVQAKHVVQSFKPGEVTPELANQIGQELAKEIAKGHEVAIYTHADKEHIHNHIVINSVNVESGKKYVDNAKNLYFIREQSDRLCEKHDLSVIKEPSAKQRYHQAEYGLAKRGEMSWKDELRQAIDITKENVDTFKDFKDQLQELNIEVKERGQHISFKHPDMERFVRGKTLGLDYERSTIKNEFERRFEQKARATSVEIDGEKFDRAAQRVRWKVDETKHDSSRFGESINRIDERTTRVDEINDTANREAREQQRQEEHRRQKELRKQRKEARRCHFEELER
jgi:hypothetical protein